MTIDRQRTEQLEQAVLRDLALARGELERALRPDEPNQILWHGERFWLDRNRRLVIPAHSAAAWQSCTTLPDDGGHGEATHLLEVYGGSARFEPSTRILEVLAWLSTGRHRHRTWSVTGANILNLAVAQPAMNPAFAPLFWLALADDAGPAGHDNLYDLVGPMMFAPMYYPDHRPRPAEVRGAQIAFLERIAPDSIAPGCEQLSEIVWLAHCEEVLQRHRDLVHDNVFVELQVRIDAAVR